MFANKFGVEENCVHGLVWFREGDNKGHISVPLTSVSVSASVVHAVAQVEITQIYVNTEVDPIEAVYIFPVDSNGAVTHFTAELDGRLIQGVVKPKKDAQTEYDNAVQNQQTAFLGEEVDADIFKLKVGFLKPGATAKVVIGYVTEVKNDPDSAAIRFVLPTTVAPRYVPSSSGEDQKGQELANMTFSGLSPAPMDIKVVASIQGEISSVKSLSGHDILVESKGVTPGQSGNWNKAVVTLAGNVTEMNRDFVLLVTPAEAVMKPRVYFEELENGSVATMGHFIPSFALKEEKVELIIVVDRSGSMQGQSIRMAGAALQLFIRSLPSDCYFNVVGFGSSHEFLFKEASRKYGQDSLAAADQYANGLTANLGGTEILRPLEEIYSKPRIPGYLRQIFVLTDGEVSNTDQVIGLVKRNAWSSRLFALGIGAASSRHLVQGMATAGGGTAAFVEGDGSVQRATLSQLKNALQPSLSEIKVEWLGLPVPPEVQVNPEKTLVGYNKPLNPSSEPTAKFPKFSQAPKSIPPIFDGNQMVVFGIFPSGMGRPTGLKITARSPDGPLSLEIQISEDNCLGKAKMLHKLAVIKLIRELELEEAAARNTSLQEQIETLGVDHGITSKYTSFIAVDPSRKEEAFYSRMRMRPIPSQLPTGYASSCMSISGISPQGGSMSDSCAYIKPQLKTFIPGQQHVDTTQSHARDLLAQISSPLKSMTTEGGSTTQGHSTGPSSCMSFSPHEVRLRTMAYVLPSHTADQDLTPDCCLSAGAVGRTRSLSAVPRKAECVNSQEILLLQQFNGSFHLMECLCLALGISYEESVTEAAKHGWDETLWATVLTITCLMETGLKTEKDLWELAVNKAEKWMNQNCQGDVNVLKRMRLQAAQMFKIL